MLKELSNEISEQIFGGTMQASNNKTTRQTTSGTRTGITGPTINVNPSVNPTFIIAPLLRSSEYSFNLVGNKDSFNTSEFSSSLFLLR